MEALKLRKDVSKPGLLRGVREVFDAVVEEVGGRKFSTGDSRMSAAGGVSGAARLAVAAWSIDDTQAFGGGNESASSVRSGSGSLRHDPAPSAWIRSRRAFQRVL